MTGPFAAVPTRGRWVLLACLVCQMGLGCSYVLGVTLKHIVAEFEWSRSAFAAGGIPLIAAMTLSYPMVGALAERLGARAVLSGATLLLGTALVLMGRMESLVEFYLANVVLGISLAGLGDVAIGSVAARWVPAGQGLALGFVYVGSNLGGALVPRFADAVAARASWREALVALGCVAVVAILPFALFGIREPPVRALPAEPDPEPERGTASDLTLGDALRTRSFWVLAGVLSVFYFYYLAVNMHLVAFLTDMGMSDAEAAAEYSWAVALGIGAKLGVGAVADHMPRKAALIANFALLAAGSAALLAAGKPSLLAFFVFAHGFATAAEQVLLPLAVGHAFGARHMGSIYGALMMTLSVGVVGQIFAGQVHDRTGSYEVAFTTFAVLNAIGLVALFLLRDERPPRRGDP